MITFATDYFFLVFFATIGVLQIAASLGRLPGLLFFKMDLVARIVGLVLIVGAFIWFFETGDRNINDYEGGLDAPTQALFFFLGAFAGLGVTFAVSSVVNLRMSGEQPAPDEGLDALRGTNYVRALAHSLRYWIREWRTQMKSYFSG